MSDERKQKLTSILYAIRELDDFSCLLTVHILPKWLDLLPCAVAAGAIGLSAAAFVAKLLSVYVHLLAWLPCCSFMCMANELSGRAWWRKNVLPGSELAAIRTALGSRAERHGAVRKSLHRTALRWLRRCRCV